MHRELGIAEKHLRANRLPLHEQPPFEELEVVELDFEGKPFLLVSSAAKAWREMKSAAAREGITLLPFSGFRSYQYQMQLIATRLKSGRVLEDILTHIAIPGFSEHHSGRAVDVHAAGRPLLEEAFENTAEFAWLSANAARFGFRLSYPRENSSGIIYEPWHWYFLGG